MGSYDGTEVCGIVGLYILDSLRRKFDLTDFGLYRDDGLLISRHMNGHQLDRLKKDLIDAFKEFNLSITVTTNVSVVNFIDITLDLNTGTYFPIEKA